MKGVTLGKCGHGGVGEEGDILDPFQDPLMIRRVEAGGEKGGDIQEDPGDCVLSWKWASGSERGTPGSVLAPSAAEAWGLIHSKGPSQEKPDGYPSDAPRPTHHPEDGPEHLLDNNVNHVSSFDSHLSWQGEENYLGLTVNTCREHRER